MPPTMLLQSLESVGRRVRWLAVGVGIALAAATAASLLLVATTLDYMFSLPGAVRAVLLLAVAGTLAWVAWRFVYFPLRARLSAAEVAGRLEAAFPEFHDRLRSTVDILAGRVPGSDVMKLRVVDETTRLAGGVDFARAVVYRPVISAAGAAAGAIALLLLVGWLVGSTDAGIAVGRFLLPFGHRPWPKTVQIAEVGQIPSRVVAGQRLEVAVRLTRGDRVSRRAVLHSQYSDGVSSDEYMTRGEDGVYRAALDARAGADQSNAAPIKLWVTSGDDQTDPATVRVVPRLLLTRVTAVVTPPPYADLPPVSTDLSRGPVTMTAGSRVKLTADFNKPLDAVAPVVEAVVGMAPSVEWSASSSAGTAVGEASKAPRNAVLAGEVSGVFTAVQSGRFHLKATDLDGFTNTALEEFELVVRPDQNPAVQIELPRRTEDRTTVATVPMEMLAEDDFGIDAMTLEVDRGGENRKHWSIPLLTAGKPIELLTWDRVDAGLEIQRFRGRYGWDLTALASANLRSGDVLEYWVTVRDNYRLDGKTPRPGVQQPAKDQPRFAAGTDHASDRRSANAWRADRTGPSEPEPDYAGSEKSRAVDGGEENTRRRRRCRRIAAVGSAGLDGSGGEGAGE